jgi:hypothetical protein
MELITNLINALHTDEKGHSGTILGGGLGTILVIVLIVVLVLILL